MPGAAAPEAPAALGDDVEGGPSVPGLGVRGRDVEPAAREQVGGGALERGALVGGEEEVTTPASAARPTEDGARGLGLGARNAFGEPEAVPGLRGGPAGNVRVGGDVPGAELQVDAPVGEDLRPLVADRADRQRERAAERGPRASLRHKVG